MCVHKSRLCSRVSRMEQLQTSVQMMGDHFFHLHIFSYNYYYNVNKINKNMNFKNCSVIQENLIWMKIGSDCKSMA